MNPRQIELVQSSWQDVPYTLEETASRFYTKLFELDPSLKRLFQGDMKEQGRKLMSMIGVAVGALARLDSVVPAVQALGRRHAGYGVTDAHYDTVGAALLWTLEKGLGKAFTPETKEAWATVYGLLASTMKSAAAKELVAV